MFLFNKGNSLFDFFWKERREESSYPQPEMEL